MSSILLAIGDETLSSLIRNHTASSFDVISEEVYHVNYLRDYVDLHKPDICIINEMYLEHSAIDENTRQHHLIKLFQHFRELYDDQLRIVYFCDRPVNDAFLAKLVSVNVLDIFNKNAFDVAPFIEQLEAPARYSNVKRFVVAQRYQENPLPISNDANSTEEIAAEAEDSEEKEIEDNTSTKKQEVKEKKESKVDRVKKPKPEIQIKERVKVKEKVVYKDNVVHTNSKLVGVVNVTQRAGSSFFSSILAKSLAMQDISVTLYDTPAKEEGKTYLYDLLGLHGVFSSYFHLHHDYQQDESLTKHTIPRQEHEGINWHVHVPDSPVQSWDAIETVDIARFFSDTITVVDTYH